MNDNGSFPHAGREWIAVLDFGSQYSQLIARRLREQNVYCRLLPFDTPAETLERESPAGIILSGSPASVSSEDAPSCDPRVLEIGRPVLGICYGMQVMAGLLGGSVEPGERREYGPARISLLTPNELFRGLPAQIDVWMSHGDRVSAMPPEFTILAQTPDCPLAAIADQRRRLYGLQFHPEVAHTPRGNDLLRRFLFDICRCRGDWRMADFAQESIAALRKRIGGRQVLCGLSGGVDSSVVAALLHRAIGPQLHCVFVDTGLQRSGEREQVEHTFGEVFGVDLRVIDASELFLQRLAGIDDPEEKRKTVGAVFIEVFSEEAGRIGDIRYLAQGTLYPDVIESISPLGGPSAIIKSHHNVGGLPGNLDFELVEPLRDLFKDEVRELGRQLGLPDELVDRQPFPGPGMAVRIIGRVTAERVRMVQQADLRVLEEVRALPNYRDIWQSFAVLLPVQTVGVMGDGRTYENVIAVRAVNSLDGMTAHWFRLPYETLERIASRIINEVRGINRVVFDISSKPPSTIEWE